MWYRTIPHLVKKKKKKGQRQMCTYDLCINQIKCKNNGFIGDLLQHFVRMFYLCFILTTEVMESHISVIIKKIHTKYFQCLGFLAFVSNLWLKMCSNHCYIWSVRHAQHLHFIFPGPAQNQCDIRTTVMKVKQQRNVLLNTSLIMLDNASLVQGFSFSVLIFTAGQQLPKLPNVRCS